MYLLKFPVVSTVWFGIKLIVVGGVIPEHDFAELRQAGVAAIFPPGTVIATAARQLLDTLNEQLSHAG